MLTNQYKVQQKKKQINISEHNLTRVEKKIQSHTHTTWDNERTNFLQRAGLMQTSEILHVLHTKLNSHFMNETNTD